MSPINQTQKFAGTSNTYGFIATDKILEQFQARGWQIDSTAVSKPRKAEKIGYQSHIIRLSNPDLPIINGLSNDNASRVQLCLVNSHDGSTALRMFLGVLRIACLNGIIAGNAIGQFRVVHSQKLISRVNDGIDYLTGNVPALIEQINVLQGRTFKPDALQEYIRIMVDERLKSTQNILSVNYEDALNVRRFADNGTDAYTIFNRVQETIIRGGVAYDYMRTIRDGRRDGQIVKMKIQTRTRTQGIRSIPRQLQLNRMAYDLALKLSA